MANVEGLRNTIVGHHAQTTVNEALREYLGTRVAELLEAIEARSAELPAQVVTEAHAAQAELGEPEPQKDRIVQAMQRIREESASAAAVVAAAGAVLRALRAI